MRFGLEQVYEGENQDPDQIDEMPVKASHLNPLKSPAVVSPRFTLKIDTDKIDDSTGHMHSVKSCYRKKGCAKQGRAPRI